LRQGLIADAAASGAKIHTLSDGPRGPHAQPMFGVDIPKASLSRLLSFLLLRHGPHAVLIHPVSGDELMDHTHHALWLGERLALDLSVLR
jgi:DOPA 4,5-dioxygenase